MSDLLAVESQFEDSDHQRRAAGLGMWVFFSTEMMFFGALFLAYCIYRIEYFDGFAAGSRLLGVAHGAINTSVLLTSSFTMALAVRSSHHNRRLSLLLYLSITIALALVFLAIKGF